MNAPRFGMDGWRPRGRPRAHRFARTLSLALACVTLALALALAPAIRAEDPDWWPAEVAADALQPANAVATQAVAFEVLRAAAAAMDARCALLGGAGAGIVAALQWENDAYAEHALAIGQLKSLAAPLHERLAALGVTTGTLPWTPATEDDADRNAAAFGQVLQAFAAAIPEIRPLQISLAGEATATAGAALDLPIAVGGGSFPVADVYIESGPNWISVEPSGDPGRWLLRGTPLEPGTLDLVVIARDERGIASMLELQIEVGGAAADSWQAQHAAFYAGKDYRAWVGLGGGEKLLPGEVSFRQLIAYVRGPRHESLLGAPVTFVAPPGAGGFARCLSRDQIDEVQSVLTTTASAYGSTTSPFIAYVAPDQPGDYTVYAFAGDQQMEFHFSVVEQLPPAPPQEFTQHDNGDGTVTFSWIGAPAESETFSISMEMPYGGFEVVHEVATAQLPAPDPVSGRYSLTLEWADLNIDPDLP